MISSDPDMPASTNPQSLTCERTKLLRNASGNSASPYLRAKCPQCFGGSVWGSPANKYPDVIVAMDGNMQHKQYMFVGGEMVLPWNETCTFLTQAEIDEAAHHVSEAQAASRGSLESCPSSLVPDGAIDECKESH
ncbi:uncharacterized protein EI90DRAFT_557978 [Cantharellus anzutake]|uniref:uncharacterized protein n=1 Tax=Cantharellus anzutake TaxID=1750568 RepID=UPI0019075DCE|nr:uncharacterized protein EI90DRAFT_557978 [Cantharellus anzutake]KAF8313346.1 hypothetical protein EI90DRAFT_557978 [Cantharellus anzutake]